MSSHDFRTTFFVLGDFIDEIMAGLEAISDIRAARRGPLGRMSNLEAR